MGTLVAAIKNIYGDAAPPGGWSAAIQKAWAQQEISFLPSKGDVPPSKRGLPPRAEAAGGEQRAWTDDTRPVWGMGGTILL